MDRDSRHSFRYLEGSNSQAWSCTVLERFLRARERKLLSSSEIPQAQKVDPHRAGAGFGVAEVTVRGM